MPPQLPTGNPILLQFLEQWTQDARGTDRERTYRRAADSMRACPRTFAHPSESKNLIGIGDKIAERLTKSFIEYKESIGEEPPPLVPYLKSHTSNGRAKKRKSSDLEDLDGDGSDVAPAAAGAVAAVSKAVIAGEDGESLFDSGEPVLGRWDRARPPKKKKATKSQNTALDGEDGEEEQPAKKPRKPRAQKEYIPRPRTGGYAVLLALAELPLGKRITKDELCRRAQPYCDTSFTLSGNPSETHKYTAWSSVKTLKEHNLIMQSGRPALFCLTDHGIEIAKNMVQVEVSMGGVNIPTNKIVSTSSGSASRRKENATLANHTADKTADSAVQVANLFSEGRFAIFNPPEEEEEEEAEDIVESLPGNSRQPLPPRPRQRSASVQPTTNVPPDIKTPFTPRYLKAGTFTVHLVLDNREVASKTDRDYIQRAFETADCTPLTRAMELGDVMWIAKGKLYENGRETNEEVELSLDYVCERKRLDDLIGSIKDGRFHEQKFRLKKFVANTTYIIELPNGRIVASTPQMQEAITTAIYSTQVVNGFFVKLSHRLDDTVRYLARFTRLLKTLFEKKDLYVYPDNLVQIRTFTDLKAYLKEKEPEKDYFLSYGTLAAMASKSRTSTLRDVFLKMLMCTKGVSAEKALEIQRHFKTPRELLERYEKCDGESVGKMMLMGVVDTSARTDRRKLKAALSGKLWEVWGQ
ncbi:Crossover junction endonuclease mus81 [Orbilia ellipsospora]|uniref:Crossover junction endonuclease MUS81 n=1 Tax=Orbilia ellipsospora TaxID=2528407 RepID=A0AAV9WZZ1_9PEZI